MESLQIYSSVKSLSRSQSPAQSDFTRSDPAATDDSVVRSRMQTTPAGHQDSTSSRYHHVKSHSRDLGSSPLNATTTSANVTSSRNLDDSPQKQILMSGDYPSSLYSPNVSYAFSSTDEYGSPSGGKDDADGTDGTSSRVATAIAHLQSKTVRVKDLIRLEQKIRDENVDEYLKLAGNADKQQLQRIKAVFEKKNQKSAQGIAQLQKKLEGYQKRIKNWETHGSSTAQGSHRPPREVLRDMGQGLKNVGGNIKDGITGLGGSVMAAPREIAHYFTRSNRFGSADNISQLASGATSCSAEGSRSGAQDSGSGATVGGTGGPGEPPTKGNTLPRAGKITSDQGSECSSVTSESIPGQGGSNNLSESAYPLKPILSELRERREDYERLCEKIDSLKSLAQEISYLSSALQEERFKTERLEEQVNDLTELHQNEVENLKQALADVEEKVQYQSEERLRDIHEALDLCQTKISKLEHGAAQVAAATGVDTGGAGIAYSSTSPAPRILAVKLINVLLTLLQLILLLVATVAGIVMPFLTTRVRILTTSFAIFLSVVILKQWPEVWELSSHMMERLKRSLMDKDSMR